MLYCNRCGSIVNSNDKFCFACGSAIINNTNINQEVNTSLNNYSDNTSGYGIEGIYKVNKKIGLKIPILVNVISLLSFLLIGLLAKDNVWLRLIQWIIAFVGVLGSLIMILIKIIKSFSYDKLEKQKFYNSVNMSNLDVNQKLLMVFIGPSYFKITNKLFSFKAFIFGFIYAFIMKYFKFGIILFILNFILMSLFYISSNVIFECVVLINGIISGFIFNKCYLKYANKKVLKTISEHPNSNYEELFNILTR